MGVVYSPYNIHTSPTKVSEVQRRKIKHERAPTFCTGENEIIMYG